MVGVDSLTDAAPEPPTQTPPAAKWTSSRVALGVFIAFVVVAFPLILFDLGASHWFLRDDWKFIAGRDLSLDDLFRPANAHWTTVPILVFRGLWNVFGLHDYTPYQAVTVALHLTTAVLLRVIMRRAGVRPWISTCAAASFVLFGPGEANIVWAFQMALVGSLVLGLVHVILADHDGPIDRRDWLGLGAGVVALMCSGVGTTMAVVVAVAAFWRRGWRLAAFHAGPLLAIYAVYVAVEHPDVSPFGTPSIGELTSWVVSSETGAFEAMGHFTLWGLLLAALLVVGSVFAARQGLAALRARASASYALLVGGLMFAVTSGLGRFAFGDDQARASRYLHVVAALSLPALAYAGEMVATRWRTALPVVLAAFLIPIPWNATMFDQSFASAQTDAQRANLFSVPYAPFVNDVSRDALPIHDAYTSDVTVGFLLDAYNTGKMPHRPPSDPERRFRELSVRLGIQQSRDPSLAIPGCRKVSSPLNISPAKGSVLYILHPVTISTRDGDRPTSARILFDTGNGRKLTVGLDGLALQLRGLDGSDFTVCM